MRRVLVIKLGALGDIVLAFGPFAAIRAHEHSAHVTLMTSRPFVPLLRESPWFDEIIVDTRPGPFDVVGMLRLRRTLQTFGLVYDLQTSGRSSRYHLLAGRPPWSGIAPGASHPHANPGRDAMHTLDRQRDQLRMAGVADFPAPDLRWLERDGPVLPAPYALVAPGGALHRPDKRWPAASFATLACILRRRGILPVIIGTAAEAAEAATILAACPDALDLVGRTSLTDLAGLAARAHACVGNDTGPMHLAAAMGAPCTVVFGAASDPALTAPRGRVTVLSAPDIASITPERVAATVADGH